MPESMELQHIIGHQDNKKKYKDLTLPAQLNVNANKLAGCYIYPNNMVHTQTTIIEEATVLLHSSEGTINSKYKKNLQQMIQHKAIIKHIKEKHKWNKNQFQSIDWQSHGIAVRKKYQIKHFVSKYVHNSLPVGELVSRYSFQYPRECPS